MKNEKIKNNYRINEQIRSREVRLVGDDVESTVMPTHKAIQLAEQKGVDLVEISPNAQPPVCRLIDYSKFLYQQKKRQKEQGEVLLLRFANDLEEYGKVEQMPVLEGKRMIIFIAPKKVVAPKKTEEQEDEKNPASNKAEKVKVAPAKKTQKEYTGPKVEGEDF